MKTPMCFKWTAALIAVGVFGTASTAIAADVGLVITEEYLLDGTHQASAAWSSDPNAVITVTRDLARTDGWVWIIDLTGSGHQVNGWPQIATWNEPEGPGCWNNLYWDDALHLHLESMWATPTGANMASYPNGFDNGVSWGFGFDTNGDGVYASIVKRPIPADSCAGGFINAYAMPNWKSTGIYQGSTAIAPASGPAGSATFSYNVNLSHSGSGVSFRTATFTTNALGSLTFSFDYDLTCFHSWYLARAVGQVFAEGPDGTEVITLFDGSASGDVVRFTGSGSIQTHHGFAFGFIVGGGNYDATSIIQGDLKILNVNLDADSDTVSDSCDLCPGFNDKADVDGDTVPDDCDVCQRNDDHGPDADKDGLPDACDKCSLVGDNNCDGTVNIEDLALMAGNWLAHI